MCSGYVITEPCIGVKDTAYIDACPDDEIDPRREDPGQAKQPMLYIDGVECICCVLPFCPRERSFSGQVCW